MSEYIGLNGVPFGEEDIQSWINDIDSGFPNTDFEKTSPRAWETELPPMEAKTFRAPAPLWKAVEKKARENNQNISELVRAALAKEVLN